MNQPAPGMPATVEIGGTAYPLRFSLKALKELEANEGLRLLHDLGDLPAMIRNPDRLAMLLSYGLLEPGTGRRMSRDWIDDNVDASMLLDMVPKLLWAATGRWLDLEKLISEAGLPNVPPSEGPEAVLPTGSPSGQSDGTTSGYLNGSSGTSPSPSSMP